MQEDQGTWRLGLDNLPDAEDVEDEEVTAEEEEEEEEEE